MGDQDDYDVGYRKPPLASRFARGRSGNPKGRPKGAQNIANLFQRELDGPITAVVDGKRRRISRREALVKQQVERALRGDLKALQAIMKVESAGAVQGSDGRLGSGAVSDLEPEVLDEALAAYVARLMEAAK